MRRFVRCDLRDRPLHVAESGRTSTPRTARRRGAAHQRQFRVFPADHRFASSRPIGGFKRTCAPLVSGAPPGGDGVRLQSYRCALRPRVRMPCGWPRSPAPCVPLASLRRPWCLLRSAVRITLRAAVSIRSYKTTAWAGGAGIKEGTIEQILSQYVSRSKPLAIGAAVFSVLSGPTRTPDTSGRSASEPRGGSSRPLGCRHTTGTPCSRRRSAARSASPG
jgi:hypothetical protein